MQHIQFTIAGEVEQRLVARARTLSPSMVAKSDLIDYWRLLDEATPTVSLAEGQLLLDALTGAYLGVDMAGMLWMSVADACRDAPLGEKWDVDCVALVMRLRELDRLAAIALARAVDYAWTLAGAGTPIPQALAAAGLLG